MAQLWSIAATYQLKTPSLKTRRIYLHAGEQKRVQVCKLTQAI